MVFGNRGDDSGTGVAFTRDPATGEKVPYGDYLSNAQGEDVVAGIRNTLRIAELEQLDPPAYAELRAAMDTLEGHYRDMCDIEFTIEKGKFWLLQTRIGKRTAFAEWVMAYDMLEEGPDRRRRGAAARGREPPGGAVQAAGRRRGVCRTGHRADRRRAERVARARRPARSCSAPTRRRSGPAAAST